MRAHGSKFSSLALALIWAQAANAQDVKPTVAPAPLELRRKPEAVSKKDQEQLVDDFDRLVRAAGARVPTPSEMTAALAALKRQDFASSDEALAQLAQKAQTLYGVHVQLDYPVTGTIVAVGKVVRADGKKMGEEVRLERSREMRTYLQATSETVIAVLEKLELQKLPSSLPVVAEPVKPLPDSVTPPNVAQPEAAKTQQVLTQTQPILRIPGLIAAGVGAGCMIGGGIAFGAAGGVRSDSHGNVFREDADRVAGVQSGQTVGAVLLAAGAGLAAIGVGVWLFGPEETTTTVVPINQGASVMLSGSFP